jgi:putative Holliday junction resolvase
MRLLGIDYGRKKIGLAIAEGPMAEPYGVIRYKDIKILSAKVRKIVEEKRIQKIVIGISEGEMAKEVKNFGQKLKREVGIAVVFQDETLSTRDAQQLSIKAGIKREKRKRLEDAYSATLILQAYLDLR